MKVGEFIKSNVLPEGMSQKDAASQLGVSRQTLSSILNGRSKLTEEMAAKFEKAFGADSRHLLNLQRNSASTKLILATSNVRSYTSRYFDICASDLSAYFRTKIRGRDEFPQLIRILVRLNNSTLTKSHFHAGDNNERHGWDGVTFAESASLYVPVGDAIWELGAGSSEKPNKKADSDYLKSLEKNDALNEEERKKTTYIFVTPHNWSKAKDWAKRKALLEDYADVRAYDASDLEQWLEACPSAQVWFADKLGIDTKGISTLDTHWRYWSKITQPVMSASIFSKSVEAFKDKLTDWLIGSSKDAFSICGGTKEEVGAFLGACWILNEYLKDLLSNCLIVSQDSDLRRLALSDSKIIPIALDAATAKNCVRFFPDRKIIIARDISTSNQKQANIHLDLLDHEAFSKGLSEMGFNRSQIETLESSTNRSPTILRRVLARIPEDKEPAWAKSICNPRALIPVFLAGSWQKRKKEDVEFVALLAEACNAGDYDDIEEQMSHLANLEDAPVWIESDYRGVCSKLDCLYVLGPHISPDVLSTFLEIAEVLLSEYDPALDLDKADRWAANIYEKTKKSSGALRASIAQTIVLLAVHGGAHLQASSNTKIQGQIDGLIANLLKDGSSDNWLSQNGLIRVYAEASPDSFLGAVQRELKADSSVFDVMFEPASSTGFGASPDRTDILWALELLAWSPEHVIEACYALAELCRYPCNDNWTNKPFSSLNDVLLSWHPHTTLKTEERVNLLEAIYQRYPSIGWELAIANFNRFGFTTGTCRPDWRDWACGTDESVTYDEIWDYSSACRDLVLNHPVYNTEQLYKLLEVVDFFAQDCEEKILYIFSNWKLSANRNDFINVREKVRTGTFTRRGIIQQKKKLERNEPTFNGSKLLDVLKPQDVIEKHGWLFLNNYVEESLDDIHDDDYDYQARDKRITVLRNEAMEEVWKISGCKGVLELLELTKDGFIVGWTFGGLKVAEREISSLIHSVYVKAILAESHVHKSFVQGILAKRKDVVQELFYLVEAESIEQRTEIDAGIFCTLMPFSGSTINFVESLGTFINKVFWKNVTPNYYKDSDIEINSLVHQLLEVGRPLDALSTVRFESTSLETDTIFKLLNEVVRYESKTSETLNIDRYRTTKLIDELRSRPDASEDRIAQIEFAYANVLIDYDAKGCTPTLSKFLLKDPNQYFQLLATTYLRHDKVEDWEKFGLPKDEKSRVNLANVAHKILGNLEELPGERFQTAAQQISSGIRWINEVLELAEKNDRKVVARLAIGELLAHRPDKNKSVWPKPLVRALLDNFQDEDIARGFSIAKRNQRGVMMRPRPENGDQERAIAKNLYNDAEKISIEYPYTAKTLRNIAKSYEYDAERYDEEGRLERRMLR